jgi:hypothetical protein
VTRSVWWLLLDTLAVYRLAILVSRDKIMEPLRNWLQWRGWTPSASYGWNRRRTFLAPFWRWMYELSICPWCVSVWAAALVTALTKLTPEVWQYPAFGLALSGLTVLATRRFKR